MPRVAFTALLALALGIALAFLAIPIVALFTEVPLRRRARRCCASRRSRDALAVTLRTNLVANVLILGVRDARRRTCSPRGASPAARSSSR